MIQSIQFKWQHALDFVLRQRNVLIYGIYSLRFNTIYQWIRHYQRKWANKNPNPVFTVKIDTQVHTLLYCPSTIQLWSKVLRKGTRPHYKLCDWDKVFGNLESSFMIHVIILSKIKVIYINRETGKEMHVNEVKFHVYQQLKGNELKANLSMTMPHLDERWNTVGDSLRYLEKWIFNYVLFCLPSQLSAFILHIPL